MNPAIAYIFSTFLYCLIFLIVGRALISWFPVRPDHPFVRALYRATEPILEPVRRIMPRTGMIDLSALVVIIVLYIMLYVVRQVAAD
jgi:YggT family protein